MMADNGKRYNDDFKADVIRMIKENGRSVNSVAKDLGINAQTILIIIIKTRGRFDCLSDILMKF
jgi:transposase-like protein